MTGIEPKVGGTGRLLEICRQAAQAARLAFQSVEDRSLVGSRPGQYALDLDVDGPVVEVFLAAGIPVLSEESGFTAALAPAPVPSPGPMPASDPAPAPATAPAPAPATAQPGDSGGLLAVVDPVDGSTNASRGIPWYATSLCVMDDSGPLVALVEDLTGGSSYHAVRDAGAWKDGQAIAVSGISRLADSVVGMSGFPGRYLGWLQYRSLGAASLDLCLVGEGALDAYVVTGRSRLGLWDYAAGMLICQEAGGAVGEVDGMDLVVREHGARRRIAAAATPELLGEVLDRFRPERSGNLSVAR